MKKVLSRDFVQRERMIRSAGADTCGSSSLSAFWICAVVRSTRE